jgi:hypothetical protein
LRSGCLNLLVVLLTASLATTLTVVGLFLLISFAALSFGTSAGVEALLMAVAGLLALYFFVRIGMSVWRDLKGRPPVGSENAEKTGSVEDGER